MSDPAIPRSRHVVRRVLLGLVLAVGGFFVASAFGSDAAQAEEWGLITNDPTPCTETLGICFGGTTQSTYDARQDNVITLRAAVCFDDDIFDFCGEAPAVGSVSLDGPNAIVVQWDMEGDGIANYTSGSFSHSQIDDGCPQGNVTFGVVDYCNLAFSFSPNFFKPSPPTGWDLQSRICDTDLSPCSGWERWSIVGVNTDYDIQCTPGRDNDGDGVPCQFEFPGGTIPVVFDDDRDNDAKYQRSPLKCVKASIAGLPVVDLEQGFFGDFSVATVNNFCRQDVEFLGQTLFSYFGGLFAWADVTIQSGTVEFAVAPIFTQTGVVSHNAQGTVEAYMKGLALCTDPVAPTLINSDLGFCNYEVMFQDDTSFATEDEMSIKVTGTGFFGTSFNKSYGFAPNGNRDSAVSLASLAFDSFIIEPG